VKWRNYGSTGQIQSETNFWISNTFSDSISYGYNQGHRTNLNLTEPSGSWSETYGYDSFWRFATITSPAGTFGYQYVLGAQSLVAGISLPNGSLITNSFDANARLTGTALVNSFGGTMDDYQYLYNQGNQRTSCLRAGGIPNYVNYSYDPIGEVTSDLAYESISNILRNNEQLYYLYDAAGNLQYRTNNALIQNFQVNSLNELTSETNGGRLTVVGTTTPIATNVTVNSSNAVIYGDSTFAATNMPLTNNYTALALGGGLAATNAVTFNLSSNAVFQYDGNGNLTNDGWRNFVYDDENQLIQVSVPGQWMSQFVYDGKKRRRIRTEFSSEGGAWVQTNQVLYVYDGNLAIQERASNNAVQVTYTRGRDMTGSLDGAGGIGGLLARTDTNGSTYYHADGNGNITMLINSSQAVVAKYLYDAFGNVLSTLGLLASANHYQFSSKEVHVNSGLVYYLRRYYDPNLQRWPNRDPIEENGGVNLYAFVNNQPVNAADICGLAYIPLPNYNPPDAGKPCCYKSVTITATRTDKPPTPGIKYITTQGPAQNWTINLSVALAISPGKFESLQIDWSTCIRFDGNFGYLASGLSTSFPTVTYGSVGGPYLTYARVSWLSCDEGVWTIHQINAAGGYFFNGSWSHQGF
jgi:RHS repeat-associated protein